jgi:hypothetical protein
MVAFIFSYYTLIQYLAKKKISGNNMQQGTSWQEDKT